MVKADWVKPGAVVLDVGINVEEDESGKSRVLGDVAFEEVSQVAGHLSSQSKCTFQVLKNKMQVAHISLFTWLPTHS